MNAKGLPVGGAEIVGGLDDAGLEGLQPHHDGPVGQRQDEDGVADGDGDQGAIEIDLAEEHQEREAGHHRRHQERQEDDELHDLAAGRAAAAVVQRHDHADDQ